MEHVTEPEVESPVEVRDSPVVTDGASGKVKHKPPTKITTPVPVPSAKAKKPAPKRKPKPTKKTEPMTKKTKKSGILRPSSKKIEVLTALFKCGGKYVPYAKLEAKLKAMGSKLSYDAIGHQLTSSRRTGLVQYHRYDDGSYEFSIRPEGKKLVK